MHRVSPLLLLTTTLALAGCGGTASTSTSPPAPNPPTTPSLPATRAYDFADTLGVNTHIFYSGTAYANASLTESALRYLGFRYVRDGAATMNTSQVSMMAAVANATGIKYSFAMNAGGTVNLTNTMATMHSLLAAAPGSIASVEGSNEVNNIFHYPSWDVTYNGASSNICTHSYAPVVALQHDLFNAVHADSLIGSVPVYNFTVVNLVLTSPLNGCSTDFSADLANIGDTSASADNENLHGYPYEGASPLSYFPAALNVSNPVHGKPIVYTETGYTTGAASSANPYLAVDPPVQGKYELDAAFDLYRLGVKRTFLYELLDEVADSPATNTEYHYGLFDSTGSPKLAATGFHNLLAILSDTGATASTFTPAGVALTLTQSITSDSARDENTLHVLLQKSDGTHEFVLWGEPALWNAATRSETTSIPTNNVVITLPAAYAAVNVYDPLTGTAAIQSTTNTNTVSVAVVDHPIVIEFR